MLRPFFSDAENSPKVVERDIRALVSAKLGATVATMFFSSMVSQSEALSPERILEDDTTLTKCRPILEHMPAAKKLQTCDLMLDYLTENLEFMMLDKPRFETFKQQLSILTRTLDPSARLLFAQKIAASSTADGNSMIDLLFDVFERDLVEMLDLSDETRRLLEESRG